MTRARVAQRQSGGSDTPGRAFESRPSSPRAGRRATTAATEAPLTEKQFMQQVITLARLTGWLTYHTYRSTRSEPGFPDLVLVKDGRVLFAEIKTNTGRVSAVQRAWLDALGACPSVETYLWRPVDAAEIERVLV